MPPHQGTLAHQQLQNKVWFPTLSQANPVSKLILGYVSNEASIALTASIKRVVLLS